MSRTVTAMFDSRQEAEAAKSRLQSSNIDAERIRIIDKDNSFGSGNFTSPSSTTSVGTTGTTGGDGGGFWASLKDLFVPDEDRHSYGEAINRGGFLVTAEVDEDEADEACRVLESSGSVDFDERERSFRSEGWSGQFAGAGAFGSSAAATDTITGSNPRTTETREFAGGTTQSTGAAFTDTNRGNTVAEEHIPIVEEELRVGKREVARGGARVRSYVREVPVHEQVTLREEHVSVERRPVGDTFRAGEIDTADAFQERNIELTETAEEAVIGKEARVREELVVRKTADEHVENIDDTVRRTEVDVDEGVRGGSEDRSAFGGFGSRTTDSTDTPRTTDRTDTDTDLEKTEFQDRSRGF